MPAPIRLIPLLFASAALAAGAKYQYRISPNPAIRILDIAQDSRSRLLWLAAVDGVYKVDAHYHKVPEYPFASARHIAIADRDIVWIGSAEGLVRFDGRFTIVTREPVTGVEVFQTHVLYSVAGELRRIQPDGTVLTVSRGNFSRGFLLQNTGRVYAVCGPGQAICEIDARLPEPLRLIGTAPADAVQAIRDGAGRLWTGESLAGGELGQVWRFGDIVRGVSPPIEFRLPERLRRHRITAFRQIRGGQLWVAHEGLGLVYWQADPDWGQWAPEEFQHNDLTQILRTPQGSIVAASHGNLHQYDPAADSWQALGREAKHFQFLLPLPGAGFLASVKGRGLLRLDERGEMAEAIPVPPHAELDSFRDLAIDGAGRIWAGHKRGLFRLEGRPGSFRLRKEPGLSNAVALQIDSGGHLWAGYEDGIASLGADGRWHRLVTDQPVMLVRSFALAGDDIWVAHRRKGPFTRLHRNGAIWNVTRFAPEDGYGPVSTHFIKVDSRGWIWRGTQDGVLLSDGRRTGPDDWVHLHSSNGMPVDSTDIQGFFEDRDGKVWIAGVEGAVRIPPAAGWFAPSGTFSDVSRIEVDGHEIPPGAPVSGRTLRVETGTAYSVPRRASEFRYRLLPGSPEWQRSAGAVMEFRDLPEGVHTLEIDTGGSNPRRHQFRVAPAVSALRWLWLAGLPAALLVVAWRSGVYRRARYRLAKARYLRRSQAIVEPDGGRYQLIRPISQGGFATVYEASDPAAPGARIAVKILNHREPNEGWARDRFLYEVAALQAIRHPHVAPVLDWWIGARGQACLAMPYLEGPTLREAMASGPLGPRRAASIARHLSSALGAIHEKGIVHRDVKPENIILTDGDRAVLIDFGTAGLRAAESQLAVTSMVAGSFHYMAPELLTGHYSLATDLYSFGAVILEMVSGRRLSDLIAHTSNAQFDAEMAEAVKSEELAAALRPAFHADPAARPANLTAWTAGIVELLERL